MVASLQEFAEYVQSSVPAVTDRPVDPSWRVEYTGGKLVLGGSVMGPLPAYQLAQATRAGANVVAGLKRTMAEAQGADSPAAQAARGRIDRMVAALNSALSTSSMERFTARTFLHDDGIMEIGGIVSGKYTPVRHTDLLEAALECPQFDDATVVKTVVTPRELRAVVLLGGTTWEVDGGLKAGMVIHNGQFGDCSYGYTTMLFRLLCSNGLMDVVNRAGDSRRHHGDVETTIAKDVLAAIARTDALVGYAHTAMKTDLDVRVAVVELLRRRLLTVKQARTTLDSIADLGGGGHGRNDAWTLGQAVAAAARGYSMSSYEKLARLGGEIIFNGWESVANRPFPEDVMSPAEAAELLAA